MISELRTRFNERFTPAGYAAMLGLLEKRCGMRVDYRVAETPVFVPLGLLGQMAGAGEELARALLANQACIEAARESDSGGLPGGERECAARTF